MQNNICKVSCKYKNKTHTYSVQFRPSVVSDSLRPHVLQHTRPPRPVTNSRSPPKPMSIESVMPSNHLILCRPLLLPSIFPSIRVFSNESGYTSVFPLFSPGVSRHPSKMLDPYFNKSNDCHLKFSNCTFIIYDELLNSL